MDIWNKANKRDGKLLTDNEVLIVRKSFFEFFCQMLKHFETGILNSAWNVNKQEVYKVRGGGNALVYDSDPLKLFNYEQFIRMYSVGGMQNDHESWSFLRYFTSMPLFKRLVERYELEDDNKELHIFKQRIREINRNKSTNLLDQASNTAPVVIHRYPFHKIIEQSKQKIPHPLKPGNATNNASSSLLALS